MKEGFRQAMSWLHTWTGLCGGWILFFMFLTGTLGFVNAEIDRWMKPEAPLHARVPSTARLLQMAEQRLQDVAPQAERWTIRFPARGASGSSWNGQLLLQWPEGRESIDLITGEAQTAVPTPIRATGGGRTLYRLHYRFHYLPPALALWIAGFFGMAMFVACVTGVIVHKKFFADFFTFRPGKGQRSWLDLHNLLAVSALPFHLMITYTGLVFLAYVYVAPVVEARYGPGLEARQSFTKAMLDWNLSRADGAVESVVPSGQAAELIPLGSLLNATTAQWGKRPIASVVVDHPGDAQARVTFNVSSDSNVARRAEALVFDGVSGERLRHDGSIPRSLPKQVADVSMSLHEGLFAGAGLRWLYVLSSLLGTMMVATGLLLWTVKRRQKQERKQGRVSIGLILVERINVAVVAGLPIAIAAYFWANRLIPVSMAGRAAWEVHALFLTWAVLLLHALLRPAERAWIEQCGLAALAYALLPLLNVLTTERHLGASLRQGDWSLASVDLGMLATGILFAIAAWRLRRRYCAVKV